MRFPAGVWKTVRFYLAFALAYFAFSTVAFAQYFIPSESMRPTLEVGDRILVNKFAYGWSRYSLPIRLAELVKLDGRIMARAPHRGDVVVFRRPDQAIILVKRVIGMPGDTIAMQDGQLFIDGKPAPLDAQANVVLTSSGAPQHAEREAEQLPNGDSHLVYDQGRSQADDFGPYTVPDNCFLMLGDNRDNSLDSRFWGCVPLENIVGKAETVDWTLAWLHPDPNDVRLNRLWRGL